MKKNNEGLNKMIKIIKLAFLVGLLISTYFISEEFINFILTVDAIVLKRVLNIILVVIVMIFDKK